MSELTEILAHNQQFVSSQGYKEFESTKYPERKLAVLSCMDTRMTELLPAALGLRNGDAKMIKSAGALVMHPWGAVMRSLLVAVFELGVEEVMVVAHYDCGMRGLNPEAFLGAAREHGIPDERIDMLKNAGIDLDQWLTGFDNVQDSVRHTVDTIRSHPLMPKHIAVHGLVIDPHTGKLDLIEDGYDNVSSTTQREAQ